MPNSVEATAITTADVQVKATTGIVYWVLASAGATGGAWQLNDSTDDTGTDLVSAVSPASSIVFIPFDPPVEFGTGIWADVPGTNITLTIGFK